MRMPLLGWLGIGLVGGAIAAYFRVPAGGVIGSLFTTGMTRILLRPRPIARWVRLSGRIVLGALIGASVNAESLRASAQHIGPILVGLAGTTAVAVLAGLLLHRLGRLDLATSMFAAAPAGVGEMATAAEDVGGDPGIVAALHITRIVGTVMLIPPLAAFIFLSR